MEYNKDMAYKSVGLIVVSASDIIRRPLVCTHVYSSILSTVDCSLILKADTTTGDCHGQMNGENFGKWVMEKLLPSRSERSAVIMDNTSYDSV